MRDSARWLVWSGTERLGLTFGNSLLDPDAVEKAVEEVLLGAGYGKSCQWRAKT